MILSECSALSNTIEVILEAVQLILSPVKAPGKENPRIRKEVESTLVEFEPLLAYILL